MVFAARRKFVGTGEAGFRKRLLTNEIYSAGKQCSKFTRQVTISLLTASKRRVTVERSRVPHSFTRLDHDHPEECEMRNRILFLGDTSCDSYVIYRKNLRNKLLKCLYVKIYGTRIEVNATFHRAFRLSLKEEKKLEEAPTNKTGLAFSGRAARQFMVFGR